MTITVLFFANLRTLVNEPKASIQLEQALSPRQLAEHLENTHDGLSLKGALCAVNEHYADLDKPLSDGDTIAFFPPVSGG